MKGIANIILAVVFVLAFTAAFVFVLKPGDDIVLGSIAGGVISLVLAYAPGVAGWYDPLPSKTKQLINIGLMFLSAVVIFAASCGGIISIGYACDLGGATGLIMLFLFEIIGNTGVYKATNYLRR